MGVTVPQSQAQEAQPQEELTADSQGKPSAQGEAQAPAAGNTDALRKAAQNPVASLISVPVQENWNFGIGPNERIQNVMNIQPVIPLSMGKDWNLIIRWITPVIYQPVDVPQASGPAVQPGYYGLGPSVVVLVQPNKWTLGFLVNNVWSLAGNPHLPNVNQFLLQYFINYNLPKGWYITWQPTLTANWKATNGGRWVVPVGGGIGRIMRLGAQPVNLTAQFYGNAVHPPGASPWSMRLQIAFLFPKMPKK
jgi:hypothetical protein